MSDFGGVGVTTSFNQSSVVNQMNVSNSTHCDQVDTLAHLFFMLVYSLVFLVGLLLNGFTLKVYFCRVQQASSSMTIYLKNLAAADFLMSLCLPIRITNYASSSVPVLQVYCNFGASAFYLNMYASILFMGYIAANRYLKIIHPLGTHILQTVRAAHIISTVTWVFLLATTSAYVILSLVTQKPLDCVPKTVSCDVLHSKQLSLFYKLIHTCSAAIFLLVLVSLVFFYYRVSRRLSLVQQRQPVSSSCKKLAKSRRNMLVLVSVFCVCFVPYHLIRLPYAFLKGHCLRNQAFFYLKELTVMASVLNVCLDPLIYFIFCKAFRSQLSLRRVFSTTQDATHRANPERRRNSGQMSGIKINRKTSLSTSTKQTTVL
ncbi:P2Y purinoceptor 14-like isoform X1 [Siniperca chuatsi]|uniref:P2Y purinoceptor 14-like isoform X1 n=1 Tax=Siniperca chuatsi TaxID=119488 RepID=UPI001CE07621|nr:P2Y purinoceptor 14-like isoform X1 [Siniperca chuatsi]XP_044059188.1 P2Y purinoceptor 14-like isoform X1 [Siniperca chuatsi]XP_044059189.1 P2Y purinoceptor 14-like isoform X1 [Siniperca chuatsi]